MTTIELHNLSDEVEDLQQRLCAAGYLDEDQVDADYGEETAAAFERFCLDRNLDASQGLTDKIWAALVDASFSLGDRSLYLKMPYFHGNDVKNLQQALGALGFECGGTDGIFGAYTELALRKFQMNMGLYADGIAGSQTYLAIKHLKHNWVGKGATSNSEYLGFARISDVLERHALCFYGMNEFTRDVASRISNLAIATNPCSKVVSAEDLLCPPDSSMMMIRIILPDEPTSATMPRVCYDADADMARRFKAAQLAATRSASPRVAIELPADAYCWEGAGVERSAQHYAITLLDDICLALSLIEEV